MADIALGCLSLVKEAYLISRFIAQTAKSAIHSSSEKQRLLQELDYEFLYLRSFGHLFFQQSGQLVNHEGLNREWLQQVEWILDNLRLSWADYAKLAAEKDTVYKKFSPFIQIEGPGQQGLLDFKAFQEEVEQESDVWTIASVESLTLENTAEEERKKKLKLPEFNWRWALWQKRRLERTLATSQRWTGKLKELVQLTMAVNPRHSSLQAIALDTFSVEPDVSILGLASHARLLQINMDSSSGGKDPADLKAEGFVLTIPSRASSLAVGQLLQQNTGDRPKEVLVEFKHIHLADDEIKPGLEDSEGARVWKLAKLLTCSNDEIGTLNLEGYMQGVLPNAVTFVYSFPSWAAFSIPLSLYDLIRRPIWKSPGLTLPFRFHIAQRIASNLTALHADQWVHKSFRSESIVFFKRRDGSINYQHPSLVNFEYARSVDSKTRWDYDDDTEKNLYRHPDRQGPPKRAFHRIHDLYALGIVLLEIGLWRTMSKIRDEIQTNLPFGELTDPDTLKEKLVELAARELPPSMGSAYAEAVRACIETSFTVGEDDAEFAMAVYEQVVQKLDWKSLDIA